MMPRVLRHLSPLACAIWMLVLPSAVYADPEAVEAFKAVLYAAESGDTNAQYIVGRAYSEGSLGASKEPQEAAKWYRKAAEGGDARSQTELGVQYAVGNGVTKDPVEAIKWFRLASEQGNAKAQVFLGVAYERGDFVPQSYPHALQLYRQAANKGAPVAQQALSRMYYFGHGVPQDYVLAHMWINLATSNMPPTDIPSDMEKLRDGIAELMTTEQLAEAQRLARDWKPEASAQ